MTRTSDGHRFPLRLDGALHAALIAEARRSGRSPSVVVRQALAAYLDVDERGRAVNSQAHKRPTTHEFTSAQATHDEENPP